MEEGLYFVFKGPVLGHAIAAGSFLFCCEVGVLEARGG